MQISKIHILLIAVMLCSCSVKEDRSSCPCKLRVSICEDQRLGTALFLKGDNGCDVIVDMSDCDNGIDIELPRGKYEMTAVRRSSDCMGERLSEMKCGLSADSLLLVNYGNPSDSIYARKSTVDCTGDRSYVLFEADKQYAGIFLVLDSLSCVNGGLWLSGQVDGIDIYSLLPHGGEFRCAMDSLVRGIYRTAVPRQKDSSLKLEIVDCQSGRIKTFDIGRSIIEAGYDWQKNDLNDILVHLNASGTIENIVEVEHWQNGMEYIEKL